LRARKKEREREREKENERERERGREKLGNHLRRDGLGHALQFFHK
jgi:hypothetical protein